MHFLMDAPICGNDGLCVSVVPQRGAAQLVAAMARIARDFGREVATTDAAREIFGIRR